MLTITEYLKEIFEEFKKHCDKGTQCMWELSQNGLKDNSPRLTSNKPSIYSNPTKQQLYLLKYAYTYGFEYLSMYNEFIEDFAAKDEISVVSLGCGTMLDYWALVCMLDERKVSRPVVKYLGIDAVKWNHNFETKVRDKDRKTFTFSQESFVEFFKRQNNQFNAYDIYFFPKSISEFSKKNDMEMMLNNLSEIKKDTIYFCISLRKGDKEVSNDDIQKVQMIIDKLEEEKTGFRVKNVKCITDTEQTVSRLKENGLHVKKITVIKLGKKKSANDKNIWDTDVAKNIGGYPQISEDDPMICYLKNLKTKCVYNSSKKNMPCKGCKNNSCTIVQEQTMKKTKYICDLIITFERRGRYDSKC